LPFYAVLRATPDKFGGLLLMIFTIIDLLFIDLIGDDVTAVYTEDTVEKINQQIDEGETE